MRRLKLRNGTLTAITLVMGGIAFLYLFDRAGSFLDEDGTLQEPFFLLPMGFLLIFLGGLLWVVCRIFGLISRWWGRRGQGASL